MAKVTHGGVKGIRAAFLDARQALQDAALAEDPAPHLPREGRRPGQWDGAPWDKLPPDCPVQVVGHNGGITYVVSATGELFEVDKWDRPTIFRLFAPFTNYLYFHWPRFGKPKETEAGEMMTPINGLEVDKAAACLINAGARAGLFDPARAHRGRGGWKDRAGRFLWHSGEYLWTATGGARSRLEAARPGLLDGALYTRQPDTLRPWEEAVTADDTPATKIFDALRSWSWERPLIDPVLILGWIMTAWMGGALDQRPIVFTTGGHGAGKTTLQNIIRELFRHVAFASANTTAAGVYQNLGRDSRPVLIDELEAKPGDARATAIIELARIAYSGDSLDRGGSDHVGTSFTARSAFFLSAILHPPLHVQDRSRMAVLNLSRLDRADRHRKLDKPLDVKEADGRMLLRQVMDGWVDFTTRLLPKWKVALVRAGLSDRLADTYGTLLAAAELAIGPEALREAGLPVYDDEALGELVLAATEAERAEQVDTWVECVMLLLSSQVDVWKAGEKPTVGGILEELRETQAFAGEARARLATAGLGLVEPGKACDGWGLAVPPTGPLLDRVFADTKFAKGGWFQALKQGDPAVVLRGEALRRPKIGKDGLQEMDEQGRPRWVDGAVVKINGVAQRCVVVDVGGF